MLQVSTATKTAYRDGIGKKVVTISFPNIPASYSDDDIVKESLSVKEILEANEYLQFTGCNASKATFSLFGITDNFKGQAVTITIQAGNTDVIPLFNGYVDSQSTKDYTTGMCEFVCYDALYSIGQTDVADWYKNSVTFPITIGSFRSALFTYLGLTVESATLVNDLVEIDRQYVPENLAAIDVIKAICQINGVYGVMNRSGSFEFRELQTIIPGALYESVDYYKNIDYQRYSVKSIEKVIVRQSDSEVGATYGNDGNTYIVQGNMFTYNLDDVVLYQIAGNIHGIVTGKEYIPYGADIYGMPWVEVGDVITIPVYDLSTQTSTDMSFYVLSRSLKGIQALMDTVTAEGQEYQTVFLSNLNTQIDTIKADVQDIKRALDNAVIKHFQAHNAAQLSISDSYVKVLDFTPFNHFATDTTDFVFEGSIELTATSTEIISTTAYDITPVVADVKYVLNNNDESYHPIEIYDDGTHTFTLNYQFAGLVKNTKTNLEVYVKATSGAITIDANKAIGYLWAQNIEERAIVKIEVTTMPTKVSYNFGENLNLTGLVITGTFNDETTANVTSICTFSPANGDALVNEGTQTVVATYTDGDITLQTSFEIEVGSMDLLRYLVYDETLSNIYVHGLNTANIEADGIHELNIPNTWNGKFLMLRD